MTPQISGDQEVFSHPVVAGATHGLPSIRVAQELDGTVSGFLHRGHEESVASVLNLDPDAAHVPANHRNPLPEGLAHNEPEAPPEDFGYATFVLPRGSVHSVPAAPPKAVRKLVSRSYAGVPLLR